MLGTGFLVMILVFSCFFTGNDLFILERECNSMIIHST